MLCPRCRTGELDFICTEDNFVHEETIPTTVYVFLCMQCLLYRQEYYKLNELMMESEGDIGR